MFWPFLLLANNRNRLLQGVTEYFKMIIGFSAGLLTPAKKKEKRLNVERTKLLCRFPGCSESDIMSEICLVNYPFIWKILDDII